ncbi:MAG: Inner membrane protein oxaA [Candidatus Magnetoglobus multicellularis str. Araruama]|uniref:Membrane protein insertase YidC n=1 Tax=Candidatus Magnetoglobus multicellularis str. Araruama TaxID=890399 RepID=A0A1V1PIM2_9BACT|nr:MAG: Inner membrane protein oxaA [Candidatus Magnetoglobus multicellularis str. Araruama]
MEQIRFLLAIALSFLVLVVWQNYFIEKPPEQQSEVLEDDVTELISDSGNIEPQPPIEKSLSSQTPEIQPQKELTLDQRPPKQIIVKTPLFEATFSEKGASITTLTLLNYKTTLSEDSSFMSIISLDDPGTALISFKNNLIPDLDRVVYEAQTSQRILHVSTPQELSFSYQLPQGFKIVKIYLFDPISYLIGLSVVIENPMDFPIGDQLQISMRRQKPENTGGYIFEGPAILIDNQLEEIGIDDIEDNGTYSGKISWAAIEDRYFASAFLPLGILENCQAQVSLQNQIIQVDMQLPHGNIAPKTREMFNFNLFFGPKSLDILSSMDNNLNEIINFGWFDFIARPCLYLMNLIYQYIPNYGIAIILLTLLIKILFWPLGNKSYQSMNEMRKLQPMMKKLQEKYKDDRQKMNQELMSLYRTYKVNPLGGCLPMILQIPVFIALYQMLYQAIELRHAPFFLWINDLSAPDRLFQFEGYIPLMQEPYGIPVLTIIMGGTMILQQKMSPAPGDPSQAKMMMFLPVVFTFIFINFPAGLVLYWLINNVASILQQYYINKKNE